jgi:hypothetical protein
MLLKLKIRHKRYNTFIVCLLFFIAIPFAGAKPDVSKHHQIMAGLLLHLASFTQWTEQNSNSINLCILGDDRFKQYINAMIKSRPKNRAGKMIAISRSKQITKASVNSCHIIYADPKQLEQLWLALPTQHNILLVSHSKRFIAQGGMVNFVRDSSRVKLEVNLPAVLSANLKLSSALLKHANIIAGEPHRSALEEENNDRK